MVEAAVCAMVVDRVAFGEASEREVAGAVGVGMLLALGGVVISDCGGVNGDGPVVVLDPGSGS